MATQFTSPFYLQELAGGLNFPVGAQRFRGPLVWRRLVAGGRAAEKSCFFLEMLRKTDAKSRRARSAGIKSAPLPH